ncbi:MAG: DEAD/DEAH box helicase [Firmicutes bacterium]|nr:DEAD/DEAH box helicase [Bacillota bacterium]
MKEFYENNGWSLVYSHTLPAQQGTTISSDDLDLSSTVLQYLKKRYVEGLYVHQHTAIHAAVVKQQHTCMTTGTASGKTLPFMVAAMNLIVNNPHSKILALYPMKALGYEQARRWQEILNESRIQATVGRIDGDVATAIRPRILSQNHVIVATPDVIHAWLLTNLDNKNVRNFVRQLQLVIVDEVHTYTGVFGSNSAYLFRRLHHANSLLGGSYRYLAASATMSKPNDHLFKLFGVPFEVIAEDSSPKHNTKIEMTVPPTGDFLTHVVEILTHLSKGPDRFIAFVDSRKQTEQIATIMARIGRGTDDEPGRLDTLNVLPYRAGYEEQDRILIQERLTKGDLTGIVSTSALELGLDIQGLTAAVLVGVPNSATSFQQRIGRIGRAGPGQVIVIKAGSVLDEVVFRHPASLFSRPLTEGALYLENRRIQYIHALCLGRQGGEHDMVVGMVGDDEIALDGSVDWPTGFSEVVHDERTGAIPVEFQTMKEQAGEQPNRTYALRDVDLQFSVVSHQGTAPQRLGSLSYGQVLREAYPGAVYYYATSPFRIVRVDTVKRQISARPEKHYTTSPTGLPTQIYPNLSEGNVHQGARHHDLLIVECNLQIHNSVVGFTDRRGPTETHYAYPLPVGGNIMFRSPRFYRYYFSSGVVLTHPSFGQLDAPKLESLASLLYEGFLITIPFERQDVGYGSGRHRREANSISVNDRFIALFDQIYGSLRLTSRIMEESILMQSIENSLCILDSDVDEVYPYELRDILEILRNNSQDPRKRYSPQPRGTMLIPPEQEMKRVIAPNSTGLAVHKANQEVIVERIFLHPLKGLAYTVKYPNDPPNNLNPADVIWSVDEIAPIEGVTEFAYYDMNTGAVLPK